MVEETAAASLNLRQEADTLMQLVSRFQVGQEIAPRSPMKAAPIVVAGTKPAAAASRAKTVAPGKQAPRPLPKPAAARAAPMAMAAVARKAAPKAAEDDWEEF
jgi:methyl-accepting chemotaxis protein